jgi:hypothetical protein
VPTGKGGDYLITYRVTSQQVTSPGSMAINLRKNGSTVIIGGPPNVISAATFWSEPASFVLRLAAADQIQIGISTSAGTVSTVPGGGQQTLISIKRLV